MHPGAYKYVENQVKEIQFRTVVEFGARNVNGSVRKLFICNRYWGIDLQSGIDVDEIADAAKWESPFENVDVVVCCEVLEHTPDYREIINSAYKALVPEGLFISTCATDPREPHSALDGGPLYDGEYYRNVDLERFEIGLLHAGFNDIAINLMNIKDGDLYATARK